MFTNDWLDQARIKSAKYVEFDGRLTAEVVMTGPIGRHGQSPTFMVQDGSRYGCSTKSWCQDSQEEDEPFDVLGEEFRDAWEAAERIGERMLQEHAEYMRHYRMELFEQVNLEQADLEYFQNLFEPLKMSV